MKKNEGGSIYPHRLLKTGDGEKDLNYISMGISRRDWLAGLAMQGYLAAEGLQSDQVRISEHAYEMADTMIQRGLED
ncbi:MAG: hypothetical protein E2O41_07920 [Nitrospina sp.]|nr:MAG: hypothetical protein E2O41_07920 [Nitrospina sp.]